MKTAAKEATKTTGRMSIIGALSILATYVLNIILPDAPDSIVSAIIFLLVVYADNYIHNDTGRFKHKIGIFPF